MEANAGLVAGSHKRNELVVIQGHQTERPLMHSSGKICQICGDNIGLTPDGELFAACNECGFPVCRACYEYERKDGNQACPHCKTRYKRLKGSPRVEGDEEEDDVDDLDNEFKIELNNSEKQQIAEAMLQGHMSYGRGDDDKMLMVQTIVPHVQSVTDVQQASFNGYHNFPPDGHIIVPSDVTKRSETNASEEDQREYASVAWKERVDSWKSKQEKMQIVEGGGKEVDDEGPDPSGMDESRQPLSRKISIPSSKIIL